MQFHYKLLLVEGSVFNKVRIRKVRTWMLCRSVSLTSKMKVPKNSAIHSRTRAFLTLNKRSFNMVAVKLNPSHLSLSSVSVCPGADDFTDEDEKY